MKKKYISILSLILLFLLVFTACNIVAAISPASQQTEQTDAPEDTATRTNPAEAPATDAQESIPADTEAPETEPPEPDVGLEGTVMELSGDLTATPDAPTVHLVVSFPRVDLTGAPEGRICSLECKQNGRLVKHIESFLLLPGARQRFAVTFPFSRYMEEAAELTVVLRYGTEVLTDAAQVRLENDPDEVYALASGDKRPYSIDVIRNHNVVIVYGKDDAGQYSVPVKVWLCSTGRATPRGSYTLSDKHAWGTLFGGVYGQYLTRITGHILFHSVPYYSMRNDRLETEEYNKLGTAASMGCIRLPVAHAKWIFDNCPAGTSVHIYDTTELPVERPTSIQLDPEDPRSGWDPTDPNEDNPWHN